MNRLLAPSLNPAGLSAAAGAIYAAVTMILNAVSHHGVVSVPVIVAGVAAAAALLTRRVVTPVDDPRGADGKPLIPAPAKAQP